MPKYIITWVMSNVWNEMFDGSKSLEGLLALLIVYNKEQ